MTLVPISPTQKSSDQAVPPSNPSKRLELTAAERFLARTVTAAAAEVHRKTLTLADQAAGQTAFEVERMVRAIDLTSAALK